MEDMDGVPMEKWDADEVSRQVRELESNKPEADIKQLKTTISPESLTKNPFDISKIVDTLKLKIRELKDIHDKPTVGEDDLLDIAVKNPILASSVLGTVGAIGGGGAALLHSMLKSKPKPSKVEGYLNKVEGK